MSTYDGTFQGKIAKIVERNDGSGKCDIYYGGPTGDGPGHGHIVVDGSDAVHYWRDSNTSHSNYLLNDAKKNHTKI
ncbi:hypothetical protein [Ruminococcus albus]|uniref:Uncharacterized protein n=1 Tax=Ruminococcus albus (strain ATCC 27210 / DSM 20455 / JCM 14654 / NCDO 2250 / 7) TaxID=697329 RepID=E6UK74_RUMA7|nr:hypothetical protein [Ruminococcus albus]ADU24070.1 hypothetical protein Rumal_3631 [Ruminococcus albus 7 = DSM 20455]